MNALRRLFWGLPVFLLALAIGVPLGGQEKTDDGNGGKKAVELKGQVQVSAHPYKMVKGDTYRITVTAETFEPVLMIRDQFGTIASKHGYGTEAQLIFNAPDTREYHLVVDYSPSGKVGKGPLPYTLLIEKATFAAETKLKDPPLKISEQTHKMSAGKMYTLTVKSKDFLPEVRIVANDKVLAQGNPFLLGLPLFKDKDLERETLLTFMPPETADYRILVSAMPEGRQLPADLPYTARITELKADLSINDQLAKDDPIYKERGGRHKVHVAKLLADKTYQIDMVSKAFDAYLFLEDSTGRMLASNDDGGGNLNARILFRPTKTDSYRIIATSFGDGLGAYQLLVFDNPNAQPRIPFDLKDFKLPDFKFPDIKLPDIKIEIKKP